MAEVKEVTPISWFVDGMDKIRNYQPLMTWIVKKVVSHQSVVGVVGTSGSGKSNFVYDILMYYLFGNEDWHERFSMKGEDRNCVLLTSEGDPIKRMKGWFVKHGNPEPKGKLLILDRKNIKGGINIDDSTADELINQIKEIIPTVGLIVIDTLNGFCKGDENSNSNMGLFMSGIEKISLALNSTVIIIHHKGKNSTDPTGRGASAFNARLDINIEVTGKPLTGVGSRVKITKARDDEEGFSFNVKSEKVEIAKDEDGDPITTIVVSEVSETKTAEETAKEDEDFLLIQEGISEGFLKVDSEGYITRTLLSSFFSSHGNDDREGFKGKGNYAQSKPEEEGGRGVCARLQRQGCLDWDKERSSYLLVDTSSFCWNREEVSQVTTTI